MQRGVTPLSAVASRPSPGVGPPYVRTISPPVAAWLRRNQAARVLSVFDQACNLIDEQGAVVALVSPRVGNGPFHAVLNQALPFRASILPGSAIRIETGRLIAGRIAVDLRPAQLWSPVPDWISLRASLHQVLGRALHLAGLVPDLHALPSSNASYGHASAWGSGLASFPSPRAIQAARDLWTAVAAADTQGCEAAASQLAGLGPGSTPSGDDLLLGAMYASWLIHPAPEARAIANAIVAVAAPRTTSLSAAWLLAAGRGECGEAWHQLLGALGGADDAAPRAAAARILQTGASSGQEALAAFLAVFRAYASPQRNPCTSSTH
jgi:hypothetical protein